jgi:hypothetical protein
MRRAAKVDTEVSTRPWTCDVIVFCGESQSYRENRCNSTSKYILYTFLKYRILHLYPNYCLLICLIPRMPQYNSFRIRSRYINPQRRYRLQHTSRHVTRTSHTTIAQRNSWHIPRTHTLAFLSVFDSFTTSTFYIKLNPGSC